MSDADHYCLDCRDFHDGYCPIDRAEDCADDDREREENRDD